jgi:glycosyltransferase involved in cell wall biosynthesis
MTPKFSLLTPTRNRRDWLPRCIQSVLNQTYQDWEQIVYDVGDEGSTVEDLIPADVRVRYVRGVCRGPAGDFQSALELAAGEIVTPLSDDDRLPRHALEVAAAHMGDASWLNGRTVLVNDAGYPVAFRGGTWAHVEETRHGMYMLGGAVYWRKELTDRLGGFNSAFDGAADFDLYRRFLADSEPARTGDILYLYSDHALTDTRVNAARQSDATRRIMAAA